MITASAPDAFVKAKVPQDLKDTANSLLESMGLSMTDYIKLALISMVSEQGVPFQIKAPTYARNAPDPRKGVAARPFWECAGMLKSDKTMTIEEMDEAMTAAAAEHCLGEDE